MGYDGYSEPEFAFSNLQKAKSKQTFLNRQKLQKLYGDKYNLITLEVDPQ